MTINNKRPIKDNFLTITLSRHEVKWLHSLLKRKEIKGLTRTTDLSEEKYIDRLTKLLSVQHKPENERSGISIDFHRRCITYKNEVIRFRLVEINIIHILYVNFSDYVTADELSYLMSDSMNEKSVDDVDYLFNDIRKRLRPYGLSNILKYNKKMGWCLDY